MSINKKENIDASANIDELIKEESINSNEELENETDETIGEVENLEDEKLDVSNETENKILNEENKKLKNEIEAYKEKLLRTVAEYENFRKRTAKEKEGIYTDACEDVLKEMFPVLDNLDRALIAPGNGDDLRKGVEMTVRQFNEAFSKIGVEEVSCEGQFDPNSHNAVMHIQDEQYGVNEVVEVFQKGYKRGSKVLRYSMVKVAN